jgi:formylglycine-generating enzyme required for sulfatase activity
MAVVYSAIEKDLDRPVAIKVVRDDGDPDGHIQRLENEARGLAALHHPHIVDLYRFGRIEDGSLYYVMPLLTGGTLEDWPKPLPEAQVVELLQHLLDALEHAHSVDIIHRDIKPANILFDRFKRPMLADFGAAFMRQRATRLTSHGGAIGSSGYMSPEQARGQEVDARSDLYSTAVMAFELLTGNRPWDGPDGLAIALAQLEQPVPRLPEHLKHWQAFFDKALAVSPAQRYASAAAMREALGKLRHTPSLPLSKHALPIAIGLGVLLLVGVAFAAWRSRAPEAKPANVVVAPAPKFGDIQPTPAIEPVPSAAATTQQAAATPVDMAKPPMNVGDRFTDPGGPDMVVARAAKGSRPALAVMAAPVDRALYGRYVDFRKKTAPRCADTVAPAQACVGLSTAREFAKWLSEETGEKYRVPSRSELDASIAQVARLDAYAWTGTCHEVRVAKSRNAAQRGWAKVRKAFGKPKPVQYDVRCEGDYTLKLDGKGDTAVPRDGATSDTVVVLVRDLRKS